jgi:23S rRNA pseudouridine2605 synthase
MSEKLQKVMARAGFASRREAETWIEKGRVKVNGVVAKVGDRVNEDDKIVVDGKKVAAQLKSNHERRVILYNKPEDQVCTRKDPEGRPTVFDRFRRLNTGAGLRLDVWILTPAGSAVYHRWGARQSADAPECAD